MSAASFARNESIGHHPVLSWCETGVYVFDIVQGVSSNHINTRAFGVQL